MDKFKVVMSSIWLILFGTLTYVAFPNPFVMFINGAIIGYDFRELIIGLLSKGE
jgi:hypothetical protein